MKLCLNFFILFCFTQFVKINAQENIALKWYFNTQDSTIKKADTKYLALPWELIETTKGEIVLNTYTYWGWKLMKINPQNGKIIWSNSRNQFYPDSTKKMFLVDNMFERPDGNIDVLGSKSLINDFSPFQVGNPIRAVYDIKNGKEIMYFEPKQPSKSGFTFDKPGVDKGFIKEKDKFLLFSKQSFTKDSSLYFRTLDTNMVILDTLNFYKNYKDVNFQGDLYAFSNPHRIGKYFYFMPYLYGTSKDTSQYKHFIWKVDLKGKIVFSKNVSKQLYYGINYWGYQPIHDGFLVSGNVDTTYNNFSIPSKASYTDIIAKFDTTGANVWTAKIKHPLGKYFDGTITFEDIKRKGYWAFTSTSSEYISYLYFIDRSGNSKLICKVNLGNSTEKIGSLFSWVLKNGDLLVSFRYQKCQNDPKFIYCWGVGLIESSKLDKLLADGKNNIAQTIDYQLFPNPCNDNLTLEFDSNISGNIQVVNALGQIVFSGKITDESQLNIETSHLPNGFYDIKIVTKDAQSNRKFVVQH